MSVQVFTSHGAIGPVLAMMGLTLAVLVYMYFRRIPAMLAMDMDPETLKDRPELKRELPAGARYPSDNLVNLFEVPVLFYVLAITAILMGEADDVFIALSWTYVGLRAVHTLIHCSYNRVLHRWLAFTSSSIVLIALYIRTALAYFAG